MSRRASNHQPRFARDHNPYQVTTLSPLKTRHFVHPQKQYYRKQAHHQTSIDIGLSDATTTDTYYDFCGPNGPLREGRTTDHTFSDDSGSTRLPYYEFDEESLNECQRNSFSEHSIRKSLRYHGQRRERGGSREEEVEEQLYHEIQTPCDIGQVTSSNGRRLASRISDRPQSSMSSALTSAMVYGCGGKCQTFESVCYFVLQLFFTMGILIGVSLCIAGLVLRKSAARNLQVLVYIGIMLAMVSGLLLTVQCRAKNTARRRIKAIQTAKIRAPIPMEILNVRPNPVHNLERLPSIREGPKVVSQLPQVHHVNNRAVVRGLPQRPQQRILVSEEQGIPWWRRGDVPV
ncbi:uncharacterized protein [Euwallacea fornicatus]|uniref:uncharacterized protein n=1 Tax=Euwallacea fornicatus TaxID=995702 RepID=UPI00338E7C78